ARVGASVADRVLKVHHSRGFPLPAESRPSGCVPAVIRALRRHGAPELWISSCAVSPQCSAIPAGGVILPAVANGWSMAVRQFDGRTGRQAGEILEFPPPFQAMISGVS